MDNNPAQELVERLLEATHAAPAVYRVHDTLVIVAQIPAEGETPTILPEAESPAVQASLPPLEVTADELRLICSNAIKGGSISMEQTKELLGKRIDDMDADERSAAHARITAALEAAK